MSEEAIQLIVRPEDGLCEGCSEPLGEEIFETDDMVVLCRKCWDACAENEEVSDAPQD